MVRLYLKLFKCRVHYTWRMSNDPHLDNRRAGRKQRLHNPYNCAGSLEVCHSTGTWYRVTTTYFRCFSGPRRITAPERIIQGMESLSVPVVTHEYEGPVYAMDTNFEYIGPVINTYVNKEMLNESKMDRNASMLD